MYGEILKVFPSLDWDIHTSQHFLPRFKVCEQVKFLVNPGGRE